MNVLVTGGAGFIGSHLVDLLEKNGKNVFVLDNSAYKNLIESSNLKKSITYIKGDIRDTAMVEKLVSKVDIIYHLAAALGVNNILNSTLESISTNIIGSDVVLKAATKFNKRILIASTSEIYGKNPKQPLSENDDRVIGSPQKIRWSYSDSKAIEEAVATSLHISQNLKVITVRLFNTVGPRQNFAYGMVLPNFVNNALKNENLQVFGGGQQTRVFCHISDVVTALVKLIDADKYWGEVFNIGGEGEISILQLAERVIKVTKSNSKIQHVPYDLAYSTGFEDMARRVPDTTKLRNAIEWQPTMGLDEIISDLAKHLQAINLN